MRSARLSAHLASMVWGIRIHMSLFWTAYSSQRADAVKGQKLKDFIRWALTEGEQSAAALDYAPLPEAVVQQLITRIDSIKVAGT